MPPPIPKQEPQAIPSFYKVQEKEISQIRPWVRFWARMFDLQLYSFFGGFILSIVAPSAADMPLIILSVLFVSTWVLVEPVLLSSWGTTPGKWLLKTTVRNSKGEKLGFLDALYRSFLVWVIGLGMGLPLIYLITLLIAYGRLIRKGITFWDRKGSFVILHNRIGPIRVIVTILFFIGILLLLVYSKELGRSSM